jgi:hypothetical protein
MTGNMNNQIITDHCNSTGQDLPKLGMYAVDVTTYHSARAHKAAQLSHTTGHPGGQDDGASQSAPPV